MTSHRDPERIVRSWLSEGPERLPDRYLDAALDEISTTNQRRSLLPTWRVFEMNLFAKLGAGVAAVALIAAIGWSMLASSNGTQPGGVQTPSPTPTASPTVRPTTTPAPIVQGATATFPVHFSVPFTYAAPSNWTFSADSTAQFDLIDETQAVLPGYYGISAYSQFHLYKDPCRPSAGFINPTAESSLSPAQVAAQVAKWKGFQMTSPTPVAVGGANGVALDFHYILDAAACDNAGQLQTLEANKGNVDMYYADKMQTRYVILDVGGKTLLLEVWAYQTPMDDRMPALQRILDSLHFN